MADEHDSWFKPFGFDPAQFAKDTFNKAEAAVTSVVQEVRTTVNSAVDTVTGAVTSAVTSAVPALGPAAKPGANGKTGGGTVSTLGGSVGAGGANNPDDVKAVQRALGIADDGQCGGGTIGAIKAFQKSIGMANPDGRVDPGGATSRALAGGAGGGSAPAAGNFLEGAGDLAGRLVDGVKDLLGGSDESSPTQAGSDGGAGGGAGGGKDGGADGGTDGRSDGGTDGGVDAGTSPDPTFQDLDKPFNVRADDPVEFVNKGNEYLGLGIAGHMKTDKLSVDNAETDSKGRVVKSNLLVRTTTERPHWIAGRPIGDEQAVIQQAEELIRQHEERHREIMKNAMISAVNEMRGRPKAEADKILVKFINAQQTQQDALDAREGRIEIIQSGGRMTGVRLVPR